MKSTIKFLATSVFIFTMNQSAIAADTGSGSVTFKGKILNAACNISIDGKADGEVKLGEWPTSTFKAVGDKSIPQPFDIAVSDCLPGSFSFNFTGTSDVTNTNLLQVNGAKGVGIAIANIDALNNIVKINTNSGTQSNALLTIAESETTGKLPLQAYYQSTLETVVAGEANATVRVTLQQK
ncbi:fimbrial protein [Acinetobacter equi]|uniref:Fimbrial-type adhesion domain-containing protein n=1 Tax=Acinetobacter equi TaxID=1324350 RepID=A0A0N7GXT8_9GAMM|nr:fimbrial protein [Acinetobacter equi]ALH95635.1 hypothetical protein AOY20_08895 [Acinetobacter equi]